MQEWAARSGARDAGDAFLFLIMYVLGQVVSAYAIAAVLRARAEEVEGRADLVLAGPVGRLRWAAGHLFFAAVGSALLLAVLGATIGVGYGASAGDLGRELPRLIARTMLALPACWVMAGLTAALYGVLPRLVTGVAWGAFGVFLAIELGWELGQVSRQVFAISPFAHVYWASPVSATALFALATIAGALVAVGQWGLRSRDFG
jgi:ABC-2 type transport system permease protein